MLQNLMKYAPVAQLDRVPGYEPGGREFESLRAHHFNKKQQAQPAFFMPVIRAAPPTPPSLARAHASARQPRAHPARIQPSGSREITAPRATCNSAATPGRPHHPGRRAHTDAHQARQQDSAPLATTAPCRFVFRRAHHACRSRLRTPSRTCPKQRMQFTTTSPQPTLSTDDNEAGRLRTYAHAPHPEAISRAIKKPLKRGFFRLAE